MLRDNSAAISLTLRAWGKVDWNKNGLCNTSMWHLKRDVHYSQLKSKYWSVGERVCFEESCLFACVLNVNILYSQRLSEIKVLFPIEHPQKYFLRLHTIVSKALLNFFTCLELIIPTSKCTVYLFMVRMGLCMHFCWSCLPLPCYAFYRGRTDVGPRPYTRYILSAEAWIQTRRGQWRFQVRTFDDSQTLCKER